jgi:hypothetical protein
VADTNGCRESGRTWVSGDSSTSERKGETSAVGPPLWLERARAADLPGLKRPLSSSPPVSGVWRKPDDAEADLVPAIYDAAVERGGWTACLEKVATEVGAFGSTFFSHDTQSNRGDASHSSFDESMGEQCVGYLAERNALSFTNLRAQLGTGAIVRTFRRPLFIAMCLLSLPPINAATRPPPVVISSHDLPEADLAQGLGSAPPAPAFPNEGRHDRRAEGRGRLERNHAPRPLSQRSSYPTLVTAPADAVEPEAAGPSERKTELGAGLPPNLVVPVSHQALIQAMWQQSRTFRHQCARIDDARNWRIRVHVAVPWHAGRVRAATRITHRSGDRIEATIYLARLDDPIELIAHELEHIIEQLDGVDLSDWTTRARAAATATRDGEFETQRAIHTGRTVAQEVKDGQK